MNMASIETTLEIVDSQDDAPTYSGYNAVRMEKAIIVGNTSTVDIHLVDDSGNKYLIKATYDLMEKIGNACQGKRVKDHCQRVVDNFTGLQKR